MRVSLLLLLSMFALDALAVARVMGDPTTGSSCASDYCLSANSASASGRTCAVPAGEAAGDLLIAVLSFQDDAGAATKVISTPAGWTELDQIGTTTFVATDTIAGVWYQISDGDTPDGTWTNDDGGAEDAFPARCTLFVVRGQAGATWDVTWDDGYRALDANAGAGAGNAWTGTGASTVTAATGSALSILVHWLGAQGESRAAPTGYTLQYDFNGTGRGHMVATRQIYPPGDIDPGPWLHVGQATGTDGITWHLVVRSAGIAPVYRSRRQ